MRLDRKTDVISLTLKGILDRVSDLKYRGVLASSLFFTFDRIAE